MGPLRIDERASGFLALLFILLVLHFLKPAPKSSPAPALPCPSPHFVQVEGDVRYPGVYPFCREPHVREVIRTAGGTKRRDEALDVSQPVNLFSGAKVSVICHEGRCKVYSGDMEAYFKVSLHIPLSLNRESEQGFTAIPGIGVGLAGAIVRERERRGGFKTVEEIATVRGIGPALYRKIKPCLIL
jgi:competence ComEA-like helix-hairpin-helix protein